MKEQCPVCGEGTLTQFTRTESYTPRDIGFKTIVVKKLEMSLCDTCGSEIIMPDQSKRNQIKIDAAKQELEDRLNGKF